MPCNESYPFSRCAYYTVLYFLSVSCLRMEGPNTQFDYYMWPQVEFHSASQHPELSIFSNMRYHSEINFYRTFNERIALVSDRQNSKLNFLSK